MRIIHRQPTARWYNGPAGWILLSLAWIVLSWSSGDSIARSETPGDRKPLPPLTQFEVTSSIDGTRQPALYYAPPRAKSTPTTLFVFLHSWSSDYQQKNDKWLRQAYERGWVYLHPNFRGVNKTPQACGSKWARQDILDAMDEVQKRYRVDQERIYLAGTSGGGHMAMLMAGHHPNRFSAVSAWVGISDLEAWYRFHTKDPVPTRYANMMSAALGGGPTSSNLVEYRDRSPIHHLHRAVDLPLEMSAGVDDGKTGSVPFAHSLRAFNVIAAVHGTPLVSDDEMQQLKQHRRLLRPTAEDTVNPTNFERTILLQRTSRQSRVTIFDGGHESFPLPACDWLATKRRPTQAPLAR